MHKSATKCNKTVGKWCKNKHGASKIIYNLETYQDALIHFTVNEIHDINGLNLSFLALAKDFMRIGK
jgi:hypothetical protein